MKAFHIGDVLTVTTGRLVSPRHMYGVYEILNFLTGDRLHVSLMDSELIDED